MAGSQQAFPSLENPWDMQQFWELPGQQQQAPPPQQQQAQAPQQPKPQIILGASDPNNPLALPKDEATLKRMIQQEALGVVGSLVQTQNQAQASLGHIKSQFLKSPEHRPWYPVAEQVFNAQMNEGKDSGTATKAALDYVAMLARTGARPPEAPKQSIPGSGGYGASGGHMALQSHLLRPDEVGNVTGYYSDEERESDKKDWIQNRKMHYAYVKSEGRMGKHLSETDPAAQAANA